MQTDLYQDLYELEDKHWWHLAKRQTVLQLIKSYHPKSLLKILDIGCGTGKNIQTFSTLGEVWGIDSSKQALSFCQQRGIKNVKLSSSHKIPFDSKIFDVVTLLDTLEHVKERPTLKEIQRVLKKEGILIVTVPAYSWLWSRWDEILHHKRRYSKSSLQRVLEQNDFRLSKITYLYSFLVLPVFLVRFFKSLFSSTYQSDFKLLNPFINFLLSKLSAVEREIALKGGIPFGTSLVCVAKLK